jgi:hypothetical protein
MTPLKLTGDGLDGDEVDRVHGDLRSKAKCVHELDGVVRSEYQGSDGSLVVPALSSPYPAQEWDGPVGVG